MIRFPLLSVLLSLPLSATAPENPVVEGVAKIPAELRADAVRYMEFRGASFRGWHPLRRLFCFRVP